MGFKKFSAQRLINQYKFTRNRTSASGLLPMPNLPYHPITREASAAYKEIIKLRLSRVWETRRKAHSRRNQYRSDAGLRPTPLNHLPPGQLRYDSNRERGYQSFRDRCGQRLLRRGLTGLPPCQWIGLDALLRNEASPGAKLFKALLRNAFAPFLRGWRGNARKDDGPPSFSFFSSPKGNLPVRCRPETYGALPAAFASFPDFWRRMDWRRR